MKTMEEPDNEFAKKQGLWFCSEVRLNWPASMLLCATSHPGTLPNRCCCFAFVSLQACQKVRQPDLSVVTHLAVCKMAVL